MTGRHADPGGLWGARPTGGWRKWPKPSLSWGMSTWLQLEKEPSIAPPFLFSLQITNITPKLCSWALLFLDVKNILARRRGFVASSELGQSCGVFSTGRNLPKPPFWEAVFCYLSETFQWLSLFLTKNKPGSVLQHDLMFYCPDVVLWRSPSEARALAVLGGAYKEQNVLVKMCTGRRGNVSRNT